MFLAQIQLQADRRELAYARKAYRAAYAAWLARGSDRNIDRLFAAEKHLFAVQDAIAALRAG
jgi:hypothetical protein